MKSSHFSSNYDFSGRPLIQGGAASSSSVNSVTLLATNNHTSSTSSTANQSSYQHRNHHHTSHHQHFPQPHTTDRFANCHQSNVIGAADACDNDVTITSTYVNTSSSSNGHIGGTNHHIQQQQQQQQPHQSVEFCANSATVTSTSGNNGTHCHQSSSSSTNGNATVLYGSIDPIKYETLTGHQSVHNPQPDNEYNVIRSTNNHHQKYQLQKSTSKRKRETGMQKCNFFKTFFTE